MTAGTGAPAVVAAAPFTGRTAAPHYVGPMGEASVLTHNQNGTWTRTYPDGTVIQFDTSGREVSEADRNGNTTSYAYVPTGPAAGALQTVTDPVGLVTTLNYDVNGHLSTIVDPANRVTTFTVDGNGNLTRIVDPDGAVTQYGYSTPSNHLITTEVNPDNKTATAQYDSFGRLQSETLFDGTSSVSVSGAEEQGLLAPGGSGALPMPGSYQGTVTDANGHSTKLTFDAMGHPSVEYDAQNNLTTITRDMNGYPSSVTDPLLRTTSFVYDGKGNLLQVTRPDQSTMSIAYDPNFSQPTQITDYRGLITTFTLDSHGNVLRRTDPDLNHEDFTYNAAGQVLTDTDRNGNTTSFSYDSRGRLTRAEKGSGADS
jgi:YD repeat-containing protein